MSFMPPLDPGRLDWRKTSAEPYDPPLPAAWPGDLDSFAHWLAEKATAEDLARGDRQVLPHLRVLDWPAYLAGLRVDLAQGPAGRRSRCGALELELRALRRALRWWSCACGWAGSEDQLQQLEGGRRACPRPDCLLKQGVAHAAG